MMMASTMDMAEKFNLENQIQLFETLKMMNLIQKLYTNDKLTPQTYKAEIARYLQKFDRLSKVIKNFKLEQYLRKYCINPEEISWAMYAIKHGSEALHDRNKDVNLYMQATATFIETIDTLNFYAENPAVSKIKIPLEKLSFILQKIHTKLGGDFSKKYIKFCKQMNDYVNNRNITEQIQQSQLAELKMNTEEMYNMMQIMVN